MNRGVLLVFLTAWAAAVAFGADDARPTEPHPNHQPGNEVGVTPERLANALSEPQNWLTYFGDYSGRRYRELNQITNQNVKDLRAEWIHQVGSGGSIQTTPLVVDGIMYLTVNGGTAEAVDARTGRSLWEYKYSFPAGRSAGSNRGLAISGERLFMVTSDTNVTALDARTGRKIWQTEMIAAKPGTYFATMAPLVIHDKVIVGVSGGEEGQRCFIDAYDVATGKRVWRFYTIPLRGEPFGDSWQGDSASRGGGPAWMTGTYDPQLNTLYWGVGNPGPDLDGDVRKGDNLFACSLLALDPDTGNRKWHFQFTPHDTHDWDAAETPMLLDLNWKGKPRKLVVQANRNAFYYVLDRETGEFLFGTPFERQTWAKGLDEKGRPILMPQSEPSDAGSPVCPGLAGGSNWMASSYNPKTGLFYFVYFDHCEVFYKAPQTFVEGKKYWGGMSQAAAGDRGFSVIKAINPLTGAPAWEFKHFHQTWAGTLSTSGGLLFAGDADGYLIALDAKTGKVLWRFSTGSEIHTSPITYMVDGRQFVTVPSGSAIVTFALPE